MTTFEKARQFIYRNARPVGIVDENTVLKSWHTANGFKYTGTKKFDWQPFAAGFMVWEAAK